MEDNIDISSFPEELVELIMNSQRQSDFNGFPGFPNIPEIPVMNDVDLIVLPNNTKSQVTFSPEVVEQDVEEYIPTVVEEPTHTSQLSLTHDSLSATTSEPTNEPTSEPTSEQPDVEEEVVDTVVEPTINVQEEKVSIQQDNNSIPFFNKFLGRRFF